MGQKPHIEIDNLFKRRRRTDYGKVNGSRRAFMFAIVAGAFASAAYMVHGTNEKEKRFFK